MKDNKPIVIGETEVSPGARASINLPIADLYTGTSLHMPVKVVRGRRAGPVLFVSAAIHGDELNGVEIVRRLLAQKALRSVRGTLIAVPGRKRARISAPIALLARPPRSKPVLSRQRQRFDRCAYGQHFH